MTEYDPKLKWAYWGLTWTLGALFLIAIVSDIMGGPFKPGLGPRIVGLILIAIEALIWVWLSTEGREMIEWL